MEAGTAITVNIPKTYNNIKAIIPVGHAPVYSWSYGNLIFGYANVGNMTLQCYVEPKAGVGYIQVYEIYYYLLYE